jgi:hypothetical protein
MGGGLVEGAFRLPTNVITTVILSRPLVLLRVGLSNKQEQTNKQEVPVNNFEQRSPKLGVNYMNNGITDSITTNIRTCSATGCVLVPLRANYLAVGNRVGNTIRRSCWSYRPDFCWYQSGLLRQAPQMNRFETAMNAVQANLREGLRTWIGPTIASTSLPLTSLLSFLFICVVCRVRRGHPCEEICRAECRTPIKWFCFSDGKQSPSLSRCFSNCHQRTRATHHIVPRGATEQIVGGTALQTLAQQNAREAIVQHRVSASDVGVSVLESNVPVTVLERIAAPPAQAPIARWHVLAHTADFGATECLVGTTAAGRTAPQAALAAPVGKVVTDLAVRECAMGSIVEATASASAAAKAAQAVTAHKTVMVPSVGQSAMGQIVEVDALGRRVRQAAQPTVAGCYARECFVHTNVKETRVEVRALGIVAPKTVPEHTVAQGASGRRALAIVWGIAVVSGAWGLPAQPVAPGAIVTVFPLPHATVQYRTESATQTTRHAQTLPPQISVHPCARLGAARQGLQTGSSLSAAPTERTTERTPGTWCAQPTDATAP